MSAAGRGSYSENAQVQQTEDFKPLCQLSAARSEEMKSTVTPVQ